MPLGSTFRDYRGVDGVVEDAVKGKEPSTEEVREAVSTIRRANGVTVSQALRSERAPEPDEGSKAYGAPMQGSAFDNQNTDRNN